MRLKKVALKKKRVASAKKYIKKCKVDNFIKFVEGISLETDVTYVRKKCKILKNKWDSVKFNEGYSDRLNKIEDAVNKLSPPRVPTKPSFASPELYANENNQFLSSLYGPHEFTLVLNSCSLKAFPGAQDRTEYILVVNLPLSAKLILLDLLNEIYSLSIYPPARKESLTFFINKKDGNGVRPISLTSCF